MAIFPGGFRGPMNPVQRPINPGFGGGFGGGFGANPPRPVMPSPISPWGGQPPVAGPMPVRPMPGPAPRPVGPMPVGPERPILGAFKKGGLVRKTGAYQLHRGEHVVPAGSRKINARKPGKMVSIGALKGY